MHDKTVLIGTCWHKWKMLSTRN